LDQFIFRPRLENYINEKKSLFSLFGTTFSFVKQKEVQVIPSKYNEEEALQKAMELIEEKMKMQLKEKEEIRVKKVLKKQGEKVPIFLL